MNNLDPALKYSILWYSCGAYPKLDELSQEEMEQLKESILDFTGSTAPYREKNGEFPKKDIPFFGKISIIHAIAISGAILVKYQIEAGYKDHVKTLSEILSWCVEGYNMHKMFEDGNDR